MAQHRTSHEEQQKHVDQWIQSGLSKAAYCRQASLSYHLLVYWSRRHAQSRQEVAADPDGESGFIELTAASSGNADSAAVMPAVVIRLPGGVELACGSLPDARWVRQLTQEAKPC